MNKFICIHGHFYQPPRENPWLEEVELQESAQPYHDWNERISTECYARNGASRILDNEGRVVEIVNTYSKISFNMGATLLSWMEKKDPDAYRSVLEADRLSRTRFSGHGSAMAQVYNHMIMPLANAADKRTQIIWGIEDFESRFQRRPEGMWLAETAVDLESLDLMAEQGIKFTVLAPHQAKRAKKITASRTWNEEDAEAIDLRRPYLCRLPSGRTIALFFYDGHISQAVAFEGLLNSGEALANRILGALDRRTAKPQLVHIATDGESYGHHHKFGDMALAYALYYVEKNNLAGITIYGEYLERNPPEYEVEIVENSSWSCLHGIERWRDNCGCNSGGRPGWQQEWRAPLREALDWLRDRTAEVFVRELKAYVPEPNGPWKLRDAYIEVILDRTHANVELFFSEHIRPGLELKEKNRILRCLETQRNALLMYTSCGWFFDDISGIETVQIIKYAARVIQLVRRVTEEDLELGFIEILGKAKSNVPEANNGARIYKTYVEPSIVDILRVGAHYAMSSLYQDYPPEADLYCFKVIRKVHDKQTVGKLALVAGHCEIISEVTWTKFEVHYIVLHLGDHNFITGVDYYRDDAWFNKMRQEVLQIFSEGDIPRAIHVINRYFGSKNYSLWHLFRQEQQSILDSIFESTMREVEASFRRIYEDHYSLIRMINENHMPLPKTLSGVVEFVLNRDILRLLAMPDVPLDKLRRMVSEISRWPFNRGKEQLEFTGGHKVNELMARFARNPNDGALLENISELVRLLASLRLDQDYWKAQNIYYAIAQTAEREKRAQAAAGDAGAVDWLKSFGQLGDMLKVRTG
ncbi:MAG: DUF3536 domain-containing protein [Candidatus Omnitrophica bacterium]|nr:DUF3536 domain-containing protein [Candidatus Omnitrophota bacterium]